MNNSFTEKLQNWYHKEKRELPWRTTSNPYHIWLSEIILQQTRVKQGLPYYQRFITNYPTITDLANADEEKVLRDWQGLGYYSRARNLHYTAKFIANELNGKFPSNYKEIINLKGVGDYTASAIASFAFNEKVAVLDGNVFRVLARVFGIKEDIANAKNRKIFKEQAERVLPEKKSDIHNQAIMEFGALQCTPKSPQCHKCIFEYDCYAFQNKLIKELPLKLKKTKVKTVFMDYLIFEYKNEILIRKRRYLSLKMCFNPH